MKNKHLVGLFLLVLVIGLLSRYVPRRYRPFFQAELIRVDTAALTQCVLLVPGQSELSLERTETGWGADQNGRNAAVAPEAIRPLLATLAGIPSLRRVKTKRPDTLGLTEAEKLRVRLFKDKQLIEFFELGNETLENGAPATYLQLPLHTGIYVVPGHLRQLFDRTLDDFRPKIVLPLPPEWIRRFGLQDPGTEEPVFFEKNDSLARWETPDNRFHLPDDSVQTWLGLINQLNGSPFADNFDESQARETGIRTVLLETADSNQLALYFFYLKPPDVPEDLSNLRHQHVHALPVYVFNSSANPVNYFAAADTNLVRFICFGLWKAAPDSINYSPRRHGGTEN